MIVGVSIHVGEYECCAFSQMVVGVSYHAGDCNCCAFPQMIVGVSYHAGECKCWAFLTWFLDVFLPWSDVSVGRAFLTWCWKCSSHGQM